MARWRVVVLHRSGALIPFNVTGAARLLAVQQWAGRLYRRHVIDDWMWWRLWQPAPAYQACPSCGWQFMPGCVRVDLCRCGLPHTRYECRAGRSHTHTVPALHDGCGPIPHDGGVIRPRRLRPRPR